MSMFKNESRPDIAVGLVRKTLSGAVRFVSHVLFPPAPVAERGGTISCAQNLTATGVTNRSAGTSLSGTHNAHVDISYTCAKHEARAYVDDTDIKNHKGEEPAIAATAKVAAYGAIKKYEDVSAALLINATNYAAALPININAPFAALATAAVSVKKFGAPYLVCSEYWINEFVSSPIVSAHLIKLYGDRIIQDVQTGIESALKAVGIAWGVKGIIIGDDDFWKVSGLEDAAVVVALRPNDMTADVISTIKALPCFGFAPTFLPEGSTEQAPLQIDTVYLSDPKSNAVDATLYAVPKIINAGGFKLVKLPAAGMVTVTTPTTNTPTGSYTGTQSVTLACSTTGASIYYTNDGTTPSAAKTLYSSAISVTATKTIKAIAIKDGLNDSGILTSVITIV